MKHCLWHLQTTLACLLLSAVAHAGLMKPPLSALDYQTARTAGIGYIRDSMKSWTDHEVHDPGITMLEMFRFTPEDIGYQFQQEFGGLLWSEYKPDSQESLGALAYLLIDAGYWIKFGKDLKGEVPLKEFGINPDWTYDELVAAAAEVPEPGSLSLLAIGLMVLTFARRRQTS